MPFNLIKIVVISISFLTSTLAFSGEVYKWKDADGNIHYGDHPKGSAEQITIRKKQKTTDEKVRMNSDQKRERLLNVYEEDRKEKKSKKIISLKEKEVMLH